MILTAPPSPAPERIVVCDTASDDFAAYCLILPLLGIGPEWWMDSHNIHHVVCNDVKCGELSYVLRMIRPHQYRRCE